MHLGDRFTQRRRDAAARGHVTRVDSVAGQQRLHEGVTSVDGGLAQDVRSSEGQDGTDARGQRGERARFGAQIPIGVVIDGDAHDHAAPVLELCDRAVVAPRHAFAQNPDARHHDAGEGGGHRRG